METRSRSLERRTRDKISAKESELPDITLLTSPFRTLYEFGFVLRDWIIGAVMYLLSHRSIVAILAALCSFYGALKLLDNPITEIIDNYAGLILWWMTLGVLSSIGLGTGLHTFVLYLGPHIAKVTMAAAECGSLSFETTGPLAFICVQDALPKINPSIFDIVQKVQLVAFMWGLGTALGELPPYFMARAAARSGQKLDEIASPRRSSIDSTMMDRIQKSLFTFVQRFGFWSILAFASVPNPLFDLAGVTCGHFGVPFWTFFGATAIGKSVFKVLLQSLTVIFMFHHGHLEALLSSLDRFVPKSIIDAIHQFFQNSKANFHRDASSASVAAPRPLIAVIWDLTLFLMLAFFLKSIIDSAVHERRVKRSQALDKTN